MVKCDEASFLRVQNVADTLRNHLITFILICKFDKIYILLMDCRSSDSNPTDCAS